MKRVTFDVLLAGSLAIAPLAFGQNYNGAPMRNRNDTAPVSPSRTGPTPSTTQRNTPPYPGDDPTAPQRVPSDVPPAGIPTPSTPQVPPTQPAPDDTRRGTPPAGPRESTTTGSVKAGNEPVDTTRSAADTAGAMEGDVALIQKVHEANQKEIEMGQLAADKAKSARVKAYARKLVSDHKNADRQLMAYASRKGLESRLEQVAANTNAGATTGVKDDMHARLMGETGSEFDHDFVAAMVDEHDKAIEMVRNARDTATDPQLRGLLSSVLPKLEKHRKMAQDLLDKHLKT
jgi:putative membrane protein